VIRKYNELSFANSHTFLFCFVVIIIIILNAAIHASTVANRVTWHATVLRSDATARSAAAAAAAAVVVVAAAIVGTTRFSTSTGNKNKHWNFRLLFSGHGGGDRGYAT
jgi:hypothetical protein